MSETYRFVFRHSVARLCPATRARQILATLAQHLRDDFSDSYVLIGLDDVFRMVSRQWGGGLGSPLSAQGFPYDWETVPQAQAFCYGPVGRRVLDGMQRAVAAVAAVAQAGNHLIIDEMPLDERVLAGWVKLLKRFQAYLIKVTATPAGAGATEQQRGNARGLARGHLQANDVRYFDFLSERSIFIARDTGDMCHSSCESMSSIGQSRA